MHGCSCICWSFSARATLALTGWSKSCTGLLPRPLPLLSSLILIIGMFYHFTPTSYNMLRVKNQMASKARSPYAAMSNVTITMCCHEVVEEIVVRRTQVRPPVADSSNRNASPTTPATQASTVSTEAGQGMSQSGMIDIGLISLNITPSRTHQVRCHHMFPSTWIKYKHLFRK